MTKTSKFHEGQKLRITNTDWTGHGNGFAFGDIVTVLDVDHAGYAVRATNTKGETGLLNACEVEPVTPKEPTAPMAKAVLDLLRRKGAITSLEAQGVLRCRQLPARVLDLKRLGHRIVTELKVDPTGQKYARYHLQPS